MSWKVAPIGRGGDLLYSQAGTPSLDLRFAETKSLTDYVSAQNLITFSRGSSATYVDSDGLIKTAATNQARFDHDPTTGESLGLLVEAAGTNLLTYSEEFDNAAWSQTNSTVSANQAVAPDGNLTADKLIGTAANPYISRGSVGVAGQPYSLSVFAKKAELNWLRLSSLSATANGAWFDLNNGTVGTVNGAGNTAKIESIGNGWYRCTLNIASRASSSNSVATIACTNADNTTTGYTGDGTSGIYIWGAQFEDGSFPTSYIPTTTATVTRAADVAQITGTNFSSWYNQSEGTFFTVHEETSQRGTSGAVFVGTGLRLFTYNNNTRVQFLYGSGTGYFGYSQSPVNPPAYVKTSFYYQGLNYGGVIQNTNVVHLTTTTAPNPTFIEVGGSGTHAFNGTISRLTYYPVRLPDATLQTLTS